MEGNSAPFRAFRVALIAGPRGQALQARGGERARQQEWFLQIGSEAVGRLDLLAMIPQPKHVV